MPQAKIFNPIKRNNRNNNFDCDIPSLHPSAKTFLDYFMTFSPHYDYRDMRIKSNDFNQDNIDHYLSSLNCASYADLFSLCRQLFTESKNDLFWVEDGAYHSFNNWCRPNNGSVEREFNDGSIYDTELILFNCFKFMRFFSWYYLYHTLPNTN